MVNLANRKVEDLQRILVPIKDLSASAREQFELAQRVLASTSPDAGLITLLHIVDPRFNRTDRARIERNYDAGNRPMARAPASRSSWNGDRVWKR